MKRINKRAVCLLLAMIMVAGLAGSVASAASTSYATGYIMAGATIYKSASTSSGSVGVVNQAGTVQVVKAVGDFYYIYINAEFEGYVLKSAIANISGTVPQESVPERVSVTTGTVGADTPIYASPSLSSNVVANIQNSGVITLEKKNGDFFLVKFSTVTGYIHKNYVTAIGNYGFLEDEVVNGSSIGSSTTGTTGVVTGTIAAGAPIYASASTTSTQVAAVTTGGTVTLQSQSGSFYRITVGNVSGYVPANYVSNISGSFSGAGSTVVGGTTTGTSGYIANCNTSVNFRGSASASGTLLGKLAKGTALTILSVSGNFYRVRVVSTGAEGYVHKDYVALGSTGSTVGGSIVAGGTVSGTGTAGYITNCSSWVSLRQSANSSSTRLAKVSKGASVTILSVSGSYTYVSYNGVNGYILSKYVAASSTTSGGTVSGGTLAAGATGTLAVGAPIYASASTSSNQIASVTSGGTVTLEAQSGSFYKITVGNISGYVPASYVSNISGATTGATTGTTTGTATGTLAAGAILFATADVAGTRLTQVTAATQVSIQGQSGAFYRVTVNGYTGYVTTTAVSNIVGTVTNLGSSGTTGGTVSGTGTAGYITNCSSWVSLRQSASSSSTRLAKPPKNAVVTIISVSGSYTYVDYNGTKGYVLSKYVAAGSPSSSSGTNTGTNTGSSQATYATGTSADSWGSFYMIEGTKIGSAYGKLYDNNIYCNGLNSKGTDYYYNAYSGKQNYFFSIGPKDTEISVIMGHNMRQSLTGMHDLHHIQNAWLGGKKCESCGASCSTKTSTFYINYNGHTQWQLLGFCELNSKTMSSSSERNKVKQYMVLNYGLTGAEKVAWANTVLGYCNSSYYGATISSGVSASDDLMLLVTCGDSGGSNYQTLYMLLKGM